jgi:aryl-alcohol dehydrogenase-like predicted oxidoreductase
VEQLRRFLEPRGKSLVQTAVAWVLAQPGVTAVIAGSRDPGHTRENAAAGATALDDQAISQLDLLFASGSV